MSETLQSMDNLADVGRIVMADNVGQALREYRERFAVKQAVLARQLDIKGSVLSDYEHNRRPSPGAIFIRKYFLAVNAIVKNDKT